MSAVKFRSMAEPDLSSVATWLSQDHVQRWWRDSDTSPATIRDRYLARFVGKEATAIFVIVHEDQDIGLIQSYRMSDYPDWDNTIALTGLALSAAVGIDYLIGEPEFVGRGVGTMVLDAFSHLVFVTYPDVERILATPQAANRASCRTLEKAGYRLVWTGLLKSDDPSDSGPAAAYMRERDDEATS